MSGNRLMRQRGISLVEILVAMTIAMIILAGVTQSLLTNQKNQQWSNNVAYMQENARYAADLLARDVRMAGYYGCAYKGARTYNAVDASSDMYNFTSGIEGWDGDQTLPSTMTVSPSLWSSVSGNTKPDVFVVHHADDSLDLSVLWHHAKSATLKLTRNNPLSPGDIAVVVANDCSSVSLTQMTGPSSGGTNNELVHNTGGSQSPGNCTKFIKYDQSFTCSDGNMPPSNACGGGGTSGTANCEYAKGSTVMRFVSHAYYIAPSSGDSSTPALYRESLQTNSSGNVTATPEELVTGVEDMQVWYGVDLDGKGNAGRYAKASSITDWSSVVSARISLVLRSYEKVVDKPVAKTLLGHTYPADGYLREQVNLTVRLRNAGLGG